MDDKGRLHMPGFVGETFEETGAVKPTPLGKLLEGLLSGEMTPAEAERLLLAIPPLGGVEYLITEPEKDTGEARRSSDELIREHMSRNQRRVMDSKVAARHQGKLMKSRP